MRTGKETRRERVGCFERPHPAVGLCQNTRELDIKLSGSLAAAVGGVVTDPENNVGLFHTTGEDTMRTYLQDIPKGVYDYTVSIVTLEGSVLRSFGRGGRENADGWLLRASQDIPKLALNFHLQSHVCLPQTQD